MFSGSMRSPFTLSVHLLRGVALCIATLAACGQQAAAWTQEVYVWQRLQTAPAVAEALRRSAPLVDAFHVLAAEVAWPAGPAGAGQWAPVAVDYARLAETSKPVGLVLRVGAFSGKMQRDDATARLLAARARSLLATARAVGLEPAELQIDFDCAESRLAGYREWLEALRGALDSDARHAPAEPGTGMRRVPLVFTALPAWLRHEEEFAELARVSDGFVLQVHSLDKPSSPDALPELCDPSKVAGHVARAGKIAAAAGRTFRVALPTYGYLLAFDAQGKFFALAAEGDRPSWPAGTQVRVTGADPEQMSDVARSLANNAPPSCTGVVWFRLPVTGDRLNWSPPTFAAVLAGRSPRRGLEAVARWPEADGGSGNDGLAEIILLNTGERAELLPRAVRVTLSGNPATPDSLTIAGADGLGGYRWEAQAGEVSGVLSGWRLPPEASLEPGRQRKLGWLRFSSAPHGRHNSLSHEQDPNTRPLLKLYIVDAP